MKTLRRLWKQDGEHMLEAAGMALVSAICIACACAGMAWLGGLLR